MTEKEIQELKDSVHLELAGYLTYKSEGENGLDKFDALEIASHIFADFSLRLMDIHGEPTRERTKTLMGIVNEFYQNAFGKQFGQEDFEYYTKRSMELLQDVENRKENIDNYFKSILPK